MGKKSMSGRKLTFLLITIPIVALFFCFNTASDQGCDLQLYEL